MVESAKPSDRLIVALDFSDPRKAQALIERLGSSVSFYKIGMELAYSGDAANNGFTLADTLIAQGKKVFLDLKLHDIPNTVSKAVTTLAKRGYEFLTVHAYPQTMIAAKEGAAGSRLKLLAVTVMTSLDDNDLAAAGYSLSVNDLVGRRAAQAWSAGIDGLVSSAAEVPALRLLVGNEMLLVTPGIRLGGDAVGDQKRVSTPQAAIGAGADYLVVGRSITEAPDPAAAAAKVQEEIATACTSNRCL